MDARTVEQISQWDSRPFSGGFETLHTLADEEFSGAVDAGGAWLFMLNGRVIGVFDGTIDSFEDADGTLFDAPHPSLPLLFSMKERGGKTQAKYYTNDTPLKEASETLASNKFTGYIELSENVLSGDYYVVYHGGRSMSAAYVGQSEQLYTGDEALSRANDEVGIYEVVAADVNVIDLPEIEESEPKPDPEPVATPESEPVSTPTPESTSTSEPAETNEPETPPEGSAQSSPGTPERAEGTGSPTEAEAVQPSSVEMEQSPTEADARPAQSAHSTPNASSSGGAGNDGGAESAAGTGASDPLSDEQQWRETTTIPSLDPDKSSSAKSHDVGVKQRRPTRKPPQQRSQSRSTSGRAKEVEAELTARAEKIETLQSKLARAESERDELKAERDRLKERVEELQDELETLREKGPGITAERQLTPEQALAQTNFFVRYGSKAKGTLADAAAGDASRETIESNLQLEHHTQFDAEGIAVDGQEFEAFLHDSMEYTFVSWLVVDLLYEIIETGHQRGLGDLFEAIQEIDRIELHGNLVTEDEEGEETELTFDVILRDRMGNPLVVANINDSRDPATGEMMGSLVDAATSVASVNDELSAAFQVTKSFFEPAALETTEDATSGGLLTREKRESFVKLSRKRGYHLCLVESRNGEFHLTVPEL
ncbi:hypothetical protein [Haladaptatus sp. AB643]|uniref:DUF7527 domain-containing protein n=1 Tax=Haladaptatus sp. AB643 TaxID=2934174 RepID=UPI00209BF6C2|nr:hypothetical protein [Haladaptatus sp. AB643]MCO8245081.1 hypothetical protein [Haladaptatus sp. AB643]